MRHSKIDFHAEPNGASLERGANLAEYVVLLICIAVLSIVAVRALGPLNTPAFEKASAGIDNQGAGPDSGADTGAGADAEADMAGES